MKYCILLTAIKSDRTNQTWGRIVVVKICDWFNDAVWNSEVQKYWRRIVQILKAQKCVYCSERGHGSGFGFLWNFFFRLSSKGGPAKNLDCKSERLRFQSQRGLMRVFAAARLLGLRVRIPPGSWMSVFCECCLLSGRGLCVEPITHAEKSYRVCCALSVIVKYRTGGLVPTGLSSHEDREHWLAVV